MSAKGILATVACLFCTFASADQPNPKLLDQSLLKANELETLLTGKITKVIETYVRQRDLYRASVSVTVERKELPKLVEEQKPAKPPMAPVAEGNLFDIQSLVDHYEDELDKVKASDRPINITLNHESAAIDQQSYYELTGVNAYVTLDDHINKDTIAKIQTELKDALDPVFGTRLHLNVDTAALKPGIFERFTEWTYRMQGLVVAIACGLLLLAALMLQKSVPSWQSRLAKKDELLHSANHVNQHVGGEKAEKNDEPKSNFLTIDQKGHPSGGVNEVREENTALEGQIASFAKNNPNIPHALLQEWSGAEDGLRKLAILLGTLAKHQVTIERVEVRAEVLKRIREASNLSAELTPEQMRTQLREIYWSCISMSFVGEDVAVSPFLFLESVADDVVIEMLTAESIEAQTVVLMSLNEKRTARLLSRFEPAVRESVLAQICSGQIMAPDAAQDVIDRMQTAVSEYLETHDRRLAASQGGVAALAPVLKRMDFPTEFATATGLLSMDPTLRASLEGIYFNVALLPNARPEFLSAIFVDRTPDWIEIVTSAYPADFKDRVIGILPPLQQRMLQEAGAEQPSHARAMAALKELNDDILGRLGRGELHQGDIFASPEEEITLGATDGAPDEAMAA